MAYSGCTSRRSSKVELAQPSTMQQRCLMENEPRIPGNEESPLMVELLEKEKQKRTRRGECPDCGTRLFQKMPLGRKGAPLTEEGKCRNGVCLICSPEFLKEKDDEKPVVPHVVECFNSSWMDTTGRIPESAEQAFGLFQQTEDDNVSVITLDKRLMHPDLDIESIRSMIVNRRALLKTKSSTRDVEEEQDPVDTESGVEDEILMRMAELLEMDGASTTDESELIPEQGASNDIFADSLHDLSPSKVTKATVRQANQKSASQRSISCSSIPSKRPFRPPAVFVPETVNESTNNEDPQDIIVETPPVPPKPIVSDIGDCAERRNEESPPPVEFSSVEIAVETTRHEIPSDIDYEENMRANDKEPHHQYGDSAEDYSEYSCRLLEMLGNFIDSDVKQNDGDTDGTSLKKAPPDNCPGCEASSGTTTPNGSPILDANGAWKSTSISDSTASYSAAEQRPKPSRKKPPPYSRLADGTTMRSPISKTDLDLDHPAATDLILLLSRLEHGRLEDHGSVLTQLVELIWEYGSPSKNEFVANDGTKLLTSIFWANMEQPESEEMACEVFLAMVATPPLNDPSGSGQPLPDRFLCDPGLEGLIDALLIVMQTFHMRLKIQETSCRILSCLAARRTEIDGTRSGSCLAVLNAMEAHPSSMVLQECGLRALFNQCTLSQHAETNKQTLLTTYIETTGANGSGFLERIALDSMKLDGCLRAGSMLEWICRLFWCLLSSRESTAELVVLRIGTIRKLLHVLERCRVSNTASSDLQEAILGILANRVHGAQYRSFLANPDVLLLVLDIMHENKTNLGVQVQACNLYANVSLLIGPTEKDRLVSSGSIRTLVGAMYAFAKKRKVLQEPCLRALVGLSVDCELAKENLCEPDTLSVLLRLCKLTDSSLPQQQELLCSLMASLYASPRLHESALAFESFRSVAKAATKYSNSEKVQEAACSAYLNLTSSRSTLPLLRHTGIEVLIVNSMKTFRMVKSIQVNCCQALLQICLGDGFYDELLVESGAVNAVVDSIKTHLDACDVLESACEALWGLIHSSSHLLGQQFMDNETVIETVTCIFVMHPRAKSLLEKACGLLAFASSSVSLSTSTPVLSEGVVNVVETIRRHPTNDGILINGTYYLRRALVRSPSFMKDLRGIFPVIVDALKDSSQTDLFIKEACAFVGFAAHVSFDTKQHILSLDTRSLLVTIMEFRGQSEMVNRSVSAALTELSRDHRPHPQHY